jgi:hypothetical protein
MAIPHALAGSLDAHRRPERQWVLILDDVLQAAIRHDVRTGQEEAAFLLL